MTLALKSGKNFVLSQVSFIAASCGGLETCSRLPALKKVLSFGQPLWLLRRHLPVCGETTRIPFQKTLKLRAEITEINKK